MFLTNDFDDPLAGFDTSLYVPCLRTDDLVFHLAQPAVRERLDKASGTVGTRCQDRYGRRSASCSSISPDAEHGPARFRCRRISLRRRSTHRRPPRPSTTSLPADSTSTEAQRRELGHFVFWTLAEYCAEFKLPFDLMIGVNRGVYADGVFQGRDLYDSRVSLIQYRELFNAFPQVKFPISVLASVTNQELASYSWIFPNVLTNGHWWYSNTPTYIEHDAAARLEAVPRTKQIGYYSDMYKLEFALPKFAMYKRILAKILAERFVVDRRWTEERAVALGRQVLRGNVDDRVRARSDAVDDRSLSERFD